MDTKKTFGFNETEEWLWIALKKQDKDSLYLRNISTVITNVSLAAIIAFSGYHRIAPLFSLGCGLVLWFSMKKLFETGRQKEWNKAYVSMVRKVEQYAESTNAVNPDGRSETEGEPTDV